MPKTIISKELAYKAQEALSNMKSNGATANRLKAIIAAHKHGIKKVSEIFDVDPTSIYKWSVKLMRSGEKALVNAAKHKDGILLKRHHREKIRRWLEQNPNTSIIEVKERLEKEMGLKVSRSTAHRAMKEAGFSYITPRKNHYKQDKAKLEEFKKKSTRPSKR